MPGSCLSFKCQQFFHNHRYVYRTLDVGLKPAAKHHPGLWGNTQFISAEEHTNFTNRFKKYVVKICTYLRHHIFNDLPAFIRVDLLACMWLSIASVLAVPLPQGRNPEDFHKSFDLCFISSSFLEAFASSFATGFFWD